MATHSSVLAWRIPGTGEPDELPSMGLHRIRHDWSDLAAAAAQRDWASLGNGNPLQCSCLENPRDGGGLWAAVYGVAQSRTRLKRLSSSSSSSGSVVRNLPAKARDSGSISGAGRFPRKGNGNPLQCSGLGNLMDRGAWQATIHSHKRVRHDLTTKTTKGWGISYFCTVEDQQRALWGEPPSGWVRERQADREGRHN